jgi:hypothetical protein
MTANSIHVTQCYLIEVRRRFRATYCLHFQPASCMLSSVFYPDDKGRTSLRIVAELVPDYTASHPKIYHSLPWLYLLLICLETEEFFNVSAILFLWLEKCCEYCAYDVRTHALTHEGSSCLCAHACLYGASRNVTPVQRHLLAVTSNTKAAV